METSSQCWNITPPAFWALTYWIGMVERGRLAASHYVASPHHGGLTSSRLWTMLVVLLVGRTAKSITVGPWLKLLDLEPVILHDVSTLRQRKLHFGQQQEKSTFLLFGQKHNTLHEIFRLKETSAGVLIPQR